MNDIDAGFLTEFRGLDAGNKTMFEKYKDTPLKELGKIKMGDKTKYAGKTFYEVFTRHQDYVKWILTATKIDPRSRTYLFRHYVKRLLAD